MNSSSLITHHSSLGNLQPCSYCGLYFSGSGFSAADGRQFCCYGCYLVQQIVGRQEEGSVAAWILVRLGLGAFLAMNVMMISLILYVRPEAELGHSAVQSLRWAMLALSAPAMAILGGPFLLAAIRNLLRRRLSTDALILTGAAAAFGVSATGTIRNSGHVYFDTATMLLLIVTIGRLIEASAKNRTSQAITELMQLAPPTARLLRDGEEVVVSPEELAVGDQMIVKPGERIPTDGRVVSGSCSVEESAFTGEPLPRHCREGDQVFGGSLNCDGLLIVKVTAAPTKGLLAQVREMVMQAQQEQAPAERLADRISSVFVPAVWLIAAAAAVYWGLVRHDLEQAGLSTLAVLVVSCPCALGLATPMATCLSIGKAARAGALVRSGEIMERLCLVRRILFDKTGTITTGKLKLAKITPLSPEVTEEEVLAWAGSVEAGSEHAIAGAITAAAVERGISIGRPEEVTVFPGRGIAACVTIGERRKRIAVGTLKLLADENILANTFGGTPDDLLNQTFVAYDGRVQACFEFLDNIRPEAPDAVHSLASSGISVAILSGDQEKAARQIAEQLGVQDVWAELSPTEKLDAVKAARKAGGTVAMAGDGINDAAALAEADIGIATGSGTDLAREASDVTLLGDDLSRIPWLLDLSKRTCKVIRQNLWWAFGYNFVAISLAFLGHVHPLIAAVAMVVSSVTVIGNSMRLVR